MWTRPSSCRSCGPACGSRTECSASHRRSEGRRPPPDLPQSTTLDNCSCMAWLYVCNLTLAVSGRGERMRASGPLHCEVRFQWSRIGALPNAPSKRLGKHLLHPTRVRLDVALRHEMGDLEARPIHRRHPDSTFLDWPS